MLIFTIASIGLSAALLTLIFPGFEIHFLAWIALVPLLLLIKHLGPLRACLASLAVGCVFYSALLWWVLRLDSFNPLNFSLVILGHTCYFGVFALFAHLFEKRLPRWNALTFPTTWIVLEYLRLHLAFLASPWGVLGYSQYSVLPVAQISSFTGVYGVSFVVVTVNTVIAEMIHFYLFPSKLKRVSREVLWRGQNTSVGAFAGTLILLAASFLYGLPSGTAKGNFSLLKVAFVQGSYEPKGVDYARYSMAALQTYSRLTLRAADARPDLIAWPSSSVPGRIPFDRILVNMLSRIAQETRTFLLVGSSGYEKFNREQRKETRVANSAFLFSPQGRIVGRYDKMQLLPFDEYLPLRGYVKWPSWIVNSDMTDYEPGGDLTIFTMNQSRFGVLICSENLFPDLFRKMAAQGVDFMVSMTNEAFSDIPAARYQMLAMNVFRAIENHVAIVRTTLTGVSAIIEPSGWVTARVQDVEGNDVNAEGYLVGQIPLSSARTFYNRYGDWFVYSLFAVFSGSFVITLVRRTPSTRAGPELYKGQEQHGSK